jgi:aspartate racemase
MKTVGIIGGLSWHSTLEYYRIMNTEVQKRLGGVHSARMLIYSFEFGETARLQQENRWEELGQQIIEAGQKLEQAQVDFIIFASNTPHRYLEQFKQRVKTPVLSIVECTRKEIQNKKLKKVLLLGTYSTMSMGFYEKDLALNGIECVVPNESFKKRMSEIIFTELVQGKFIESTKNEVLEEIGKHQKDGVQGVILGCTEIPLLIKQKDSELALSEMAFIDTTSLHAMAAVELALS